ncbi:hypothetical protein [Brevibacillus laterosporus]|uniref:hypothetical protein n=1 Tax=Brevibacillus laterosporus TaxID=1465 RepID=UPI000E6BBD67|nr:hypothetical protein [Brevibacillus laterosporus]AYB37649.1 hypothetical protein D5F52_04755 [Brevibacillus laterosporus]MBM7110898.1 hypothetical protein [Brevibacillus laterosporus]
MKKGWELINELFGEDFDFMGEIIDMDGVVEISDVISYNDDWWNYHLVTIEYEGKYYTYEYRKHVAPICGDIEYYGETFQEVENKEDIEEKWRILRNNIISELEGLRTAGLYGDSYEAEKAFVWVLSKMDELHKVNDSDNILS